MSKKIVFISGHFNILHPGHLRLFRFAKTFGDYLIVGVESDKIAKEAAYVKENLRMDGVINNSLVDEVILINKPIIEIIKKIKPNIIVKGKEHEKQTNPEEEVLREYGGKLIFTSGETILSSYDFIKKEFQKSNDESIKLPYEYMKRHKIKINKLCEIIKNFTKLNIVVIGDLIVDEYITCEPLGMSQEDPTIVVSPVDSKKFIGGAGIVAAHAAGLGANVKFYTVSGYDETRKFAVNYLKSIGVKSEIIIDKSRPTTLKQRYRSKGKSLLRVSHLHQNPIPTEIQKNILLNIKKNKDLINLSVFSDFNYGCLPQSIVDDLTSYWNLKGVMQVADCQTSSQIGDISRYRGMEFVTPTEHEARVSLQNREDGLVVLAEKLRSKSNAKNIILKLGEDGILLHSNNSQSKWVTDRIEALNSNAKDVSGAGDSLLIASAMTRASGGTIWEAALIGSLAAALQVARVGNIPLKSEELLRELQR
jgi:rfaE bifunctional protein kinase chain/domain